MHDFDVPSTPKSPKPAPALISNMGMADNVQTVGGMIFDPQRMCWLRAASPGSGYMGGIAPEDEDDVFAGLGDLDDKPAGSIQRDSETLEDCNLQGADADPSAGESSDEGPMTEEFDVGPEFVRRQRAEEDKWRRKVNKWVGSDRSDREAYWRWAIRDLVADDFSNPLG